MEALPTFNCRGAATSVSVFCAPPIPGAGVGVAIAAEAFSGFARLLEIDGVVLATWGSSFAGRQAGM